MTSLAFLRHRFSLRDIPNLALWLDAGLSPNTLNSGNVAQINDLSGNGRNAAQGTAANQPALTAGAINGLPAMTFDGVNDTLASSSGLVAANGEATLFLVMKYASGGTLFEASDSATQNRCIRLFVSGGAMWFRAGGAANDASFTFADTTNPHIITGRHKPAQREIYQDGVVKGTTVAAQNILADSSRYVIGDSVGGSGVTGGLYGALLVYNRYLTDAERQSVERYLGARYGITVS